MIHFFKIIFVQTRSNGCAIMIRTNFVSTLFLNHMLKFKFFKNDIIFEFPSFKICIILYEKMLKRQDRESLKKAIKNYHVKNPGKKSRKSSSRFSTINDL